jgi:ferredoxin
MPHVVTENCTDCRYTECVTVCPVACFHGDESQLFIDPSACIDCGACTPLCPVNAIYEEAVIPDHLRPWVALNAERALELPVVSASCPPLPSAEGKRKLLGL